VEELDPAGSLAPRVVEFGAGLPLQGLLAVLSAAPARASGTRSHWATASTETLSTGMGAQARRFEIQARRVQGAMDFSEEA
jgi:hypothetical protein